MDLALDPRNLEHLVKLLNALTTPNAKVQQQIYIDVGYCCRTIPEFCFYLVHIAKSEEYPMPIRQRALLALRRYFQKIRRDLVPLFMRAFLSLFESIVATANQMLGRQATVILAELVVAFGCEFVPNLTETFRQLLSSEVFVGCVLDAMNILAAQWPEFPSEWVQELPRFLQGDLAATALSSEALAIWRTLMNIDGGKWDEMLKQMVPLIFENFEKFQPKGAVEAMCVVAGFYGRTGDVQLADFLVCCIRTQERVFLSEMLDLMEAYPEIPFYEPLILALFSLLDDEEGEVGEYSVLDVTSQLFLKLYSKYGEPVFRIVESAFDQCRNPCQILRAIWILASEASTTAPFLKFLEFIRNGLDNDECRGDAVLCLYYVTHGDERLVLMGINDIVTRALSDSRGIVRDKVFFALIDMIGGCTQKERNWLVQLVNVYDEYLGDRGHDNAPFIIWLSQIIELFLGNADPSDGIYEELYSKLVSNFMMMRSTDNPALFDGVLLSALQPKLRPTYGEDSNNILVKLSELAPVILFDTRGFMGYCKILDCFTCTYPDATWGNEAFVRAAKLLTERILADENHDCDLGSFFAFVKTTILRFPVNDTEIGNAWLRIAANAFNGFGNFEAINAIADAYMNVVEMMSPEVLDTFAVAAVGILEIWGQDLSYIQAVLPFAFKLLTIKNEKGMLQPELREAYTFVCALQEQAQK